MTEIWLADFIFYFKMSSKEKRSGASAHTYTVKDVVTRYIPTKFVINEGLSYKRATKGMLKNFLSDLEDDKSTGLKKFTIQFTKKMGDVNE